MTTNLTLHLGVVDLGYGDSGADGKPKSAVASTGDVAEILEEKYGLFTAFFTLHEQDIYDALQGSLGSALDAILMGSPLTLNDFGEGASKIEELFKDFLSNREMEGLGRADVPTGAAMRGVNHRLKHPYAKANPRRPSFVDTGLLQSALKVWID